MCIIAAKPKGTAMPGRDVIRRMWDNNPDGAGIMYAHDNKVVIHKGFMKLSEFEAELDKLERKLDMQKTGLVMHFRITTHGGTRPENTHPFPVTQKLARLRQLRLTTNIGVAHNGIISITPRDNTLSDTMEYIASQLYPLMKVCPTFYENEYAMLMIQNAITSRMAFLLPDGKIYTTGDFIEDEGMIYSNDSYKRSRYVAKPYSTAWCWDESDSGWGSYSYNNSYKPKYKLTSTKKSKSEDKKSKSKTPTVTDLLKDSEEQWLMWVSWRDPAAYVRTEDGEIHDSWEFLIDEQEHVYQYDTTLGGCYRLTGAQAYTSSDMPLRFNPDDASYERVLPTLPF